MGKVNPAAICSNGHIIDWKADHSNLVNQAKCQHCGKDVHDDCPACEAKSVLAWRETHQDKSDDWRAEDYCRSCGEAFPWGPDRITQFFKGKGISFSGPPNPSPRERILPHPTREQLVEMKYGKEAIEHINDGDKCYKKELWRPALAMYIHAFEWVMIAYLEDREGFDVVEKERNGQKFNLAGRTPNLLAVLTDKVTLDQKTIERIEDMNRAERRWMAHHRSGEVLRDEVDSVRSRLGVLLSVLFD
ncbi:DUF2321 domain-containing protein [Haloarchaeobius sp. HME9146]|uniref:DUF2321 domain-containing protein n=1 Tax=Haloarchaeobius sp. HME9146 TaxID=2978732 RepID=UPI0021C03CC5|nr:DUF2321 domain-containing protein [Haloarchaeobius sp. HME9146]MCT9096972.1 DUF2321 domain-containing protein [Haloarchaeobius sp. HME9146]